VRAYEEALATTRGLRLKSLNLFEEGKGNKEPKVRETLWAA